MVIKANVLQGRASAPQFPAGESPSVPRTAAQLCLAVPCWPVPGAAGPWAGGTEGLQGVGGGCRCSLGGTQLWAVCGSLCNPNA